MLRTMQKKEIKNLKIEKRGNNYDLDNAIFIIKDEYSIIYTKFK